MTMFRVLNYSGATPREISEVVNNLMNGKAIQEAVKNAKANIQDGQLIAGRFESNLEMIFGVCQSLERLHQLYL